MANSHLGMDWVLQYCLEKVQFNGMKVDHLLMSYPEVADELRPLLNTALWLMTRKTALDPRPEYLCETWIWLHFQRNDMIHSSRLTE